MKVTRVKLAEKLNVSRQRVHSMIKEGLIIPDSKGLIDLQEATTTIVANRDPVRGGKRTPITSDESFSEARSRKERALADMRELETAEKKGELLNAEEVMAALAEVFIVVKERLRSIPARMANEIYYIAKSTQNEREAIAKIFEALLKDIDDTLLELSRFRPPTSRKGGVKKKVV